MMRLSIAFLAAMAVSASATPMRLAAMDNQPDNLPADSNNAKIEHNPHPPCHGGSASRGIFSALLSRLGLGPEPQLKVDDVDAWRLLSAQQMENDRSSLSSLKTKIDKMFRPVEDRLEEGTMRILPIFDELGELDYDVAKHQNPNNWRVVDSDDPNDQIRESGDPSGSSPERWSYSIFHTNAEIDPNYKQKYNPSQWDRLAGKDGVHAHHHHGHGAHRAHHREHKPEQTFFGHAKQTLDSLSRTQAFIVIIFMALCTRFLIALILRPTRGGPRQSRTQGPAGCRVGEEEERQAKTQSIKLEGEEGQAPPAVFESSGEKLEE